MGVDSKIEWTHHTFNPWWGCARVSPGCEHCYAETFAARFNVKWGVKSERRFFGANHWREPIKWNAAAERAGERHRVFCASMADVFEDRADLVEPRNALWDLILSTPRLDWLLLTKRPENLERLLPWGASGMFAEPFRNVWLGTTVEDQRRAEERIPHLLRVPAVVRFLSCEPLLGPVDLTSLCVSPICEHCGEQPLADATNATERCACCVEQSSEPIDWRSLEWVIAGGESGNGARPMHPDWARSLREQCVDADIAFHFKQWGQHDDAGSLVRKKRDAGRDLDGRTWDEFPAVRT